MKLVIIIGLSLFPFLALSEEPSKEEVEKELPKADFLQGKLNSMMQSTANWIDTVGNDSDEETTDEEYSEAIYSEPASATGYLQLSWLPRTTNIGEVDASFKVALHLPKWNERLALIVDNDNEDELLLDYESSYASPQEGINVAFQYIKQFNQQRQLKNRLGISRGQLYLRSEMKFNWEINKLNLRLQPRIDYFVQDGWGPGIKAVSTYPLKYSYFSLSASWQKIQKESSSRRKVGMYYILPSGKDQLLVTGAQYVRSNNSEDISNDSYYLSARYRNLWYKSWLFFEVEPFMEFNETNDFKRDVGIAFSLISYYGE